MSQITGSLEGCNPVRVATAAQFAEDPRFAQKLGHQPLTGLTIYGDHQNDGYAWGMAIDKRRRESRAAGADPRMRR